MSRSSEWERVTKGIVMVLTEFAKQNNQAILPVGKQLAKHTHEIGMTAARTLARAASSAPPTPPSAPPSMSAVQATPTTATPPPPPPDLTLAPAPPKEDFDFTERAVPSSSLGRAWGFGSMAAGVATSVAGNWMGTALGLGGAAAEGGGALDPASAERLAAGLARMRGAALKIGQMMSIQDESALPPAVAFALARVRQHADIMPPAQLEGVMQRALGEGWEGRFDTWSQRPVAAASIGQVHKAEWGGEAVAVKVQYPGVADSIDSDLTNLERLLVFGRFIPRGLYLENIISTARVELKRECDYSYEADCQERFRELLADDPDFVVPRVIREASGEGVLTSQWIEGRPLDAVAGESQAVRDAVGRQLLRLALLELFEFRFCQTDPNPSNFLYMPRPAEEGGGVRLGLLDFGASREYSAEFMDEYLRLVWAAANEDRPGLVQASLALGFLTGMESKAMLEAHVSAGMAVGEPFRSHSPYAFAGSDITARVSSSAETFADHRLTPPPEEIYSLHRKLAGCYLMCIRIGANVSCRDMLQAVVDTHPWQREAPAGVNPVGLER